MRIKIRELIDQLNKYTDLYNQNNSPISDSDWDKLYFELQELEKESGIIYPDSPTQSIRYNEVNELQKVEHSHPMLSLAKCHSEKEIEDFIGKRNWIAMLKLDGLTCSLTYENGELIRAETRGDGRIGEDITHNAKVLNNIPKTIPFKERLVVDGEVICDIKTFNENFADTYANPRNFASGSIRLLDSKECANRKLKFIAWDCTEGLEHCKYLHQKLEQLEILGFERVSYNCSKTQEQFPNVEPFSMKTVIKLLTSFAKATNLPIDGIVYKWDNCREYAAAGSTDHHFRGGMAFKFADESVETELLDIVYDVGRTGKLTPVAIYNPVELEGTICNRASLHNISIMHELSEGFQRKGDILTIKKSNQIIPQIISWKHVGDYSEETHIWLPETCPICGEKTEIIQENESKVLYCSNQNCPARIINQFEHFCGKKGLDIKGLSKATLEKLLDWGWINNFTDLWYLGKMHRDEWIKKPGFGIASVDKILGAIEASRTVDLDKFIAALGIPLIGSRASKDLANHFLTWTEFIKAVKTDFNFDALPNFGYEMDKTIKEFDYEEACELATTILDVKSVEPPSANNEPLKGKTFVVTGKLQLGSRDKAKKMIEEAGGKVVGSVSSKTNYLINNDSASETSKNIAAKNLGIPIINEQEFLALLES